MRKQGKIMTSTACEMTIPARITTPAPPRHARKIHYQSHYQYGKPRENHHIKDRGNDKPDKNYPVKPL